MRCLAILSLLFAAGAADAKCSGSGCSTVSRTQAVTVQSVQVVQAPVVAAGGCQGGAATFAVGGCAGSQGTSAHRKLFSGGLLHHGSGSGILGRRKQGAGYEQTTTTRQWDNRPSPAIVVVPQAIVEQPK